MPVTNLTGFDSRRLERVQRRLWELRAWRNAREHPIEAWFFSGDGAPTPLNLGDLWPIVVTPARLTGEGTIPESWTGETVELELWLGGEGHIRLSTGRQYGLNALHHRFPVLDQAHGGETIAIEAEVSPKGMFGSHVAAPRLERAHFVIPNSEVRALERDLTMIVESCVQLGDHEVVSHLLDTVDAGFAALGRDWPTATDVVVTRYVETFRDPIGSGVATVPPDFAREAIEVSPASSGLWSLPDPSRPLGPLPGNAVAAVERARAEVAERLARIKTDYPPIGRLVLTGHAHIDLAWLWPVAETRRKGRRTFATVLDLMDRYDNFTFNQSSAQLYTWIEEEAPELFARVKERVAEGRWEAVGGSWLEPDCQVTGGESFVRHLLYGQRAFERWFGTRHTVAWLPDVFGFSGAIPQLLRGAGLTGFFTIKLNWNEANTFPYDLFQWEGIDGSTVTAHMFLNPGLGYNGNIHPLDTLGTWQHFRGKRRHPESLLAFGWGDGGGGPSEKMLENYARLKDFPALPRLRMGRIDDFFAALPTRDLPTWVGELYLEYHRGTLTSQAKVKELNRAAEHRLLEAEAFSAIASRTGFSVPRAEIEQTWKTLLLNQFHDILPGSSIHEVYEETHRELTDVVTRATSARNTALRHIAREAGGEGQRRLLVANAGLQPRPLSVLLPSGQDSASITDASGRHVPTQVIGDGLLVHDPTTMVPGLGWVTFGLGSTVETSASVSTVQAQPLDQGTVVENDLIRIEVGADGTLQRVTDKQAGREVLEGRGNQLWAYVDKPRTYDAWDVEESYEDDGEEVGGVERISIVEAGPLRAAVRVERTWHDSQIVQTYRLYSGSKRLDVVTEIAWYERTVLLRARFPLNVHTHEATYETMFGVVRRPTHRNTTWDAARFEVSAHRFADLSEPGYGVALLNDSKYGHGAHANVLSMSLLRGPLYPDPFADEGEHRFTYSLFPHEGDWTDAGVVAEAFALNSPLIAVPTASTTITPTSAFVELDGLPLAFGSLKPAEDDDSLVLRLYEPHGARGVAHLGFTQPIRRATRVNLLEDSEGDDLPIEDGRRLSIAVRPFEVISLRLEL